MHEQELILNFVTYLKTKLNYKDENLVLGKNIGGKAIDLIIQENEKIIAIVEFKGTAVTLENVEVQVKSYITLLNNETCHAFFVSWNEEIFILESYGWQKIELQNFPTFETLRK